jgi:hypothetical protein
MLCETSYSTGRVKSASGNYTARFVSRLVTPLSRSSKLERVIKAAAEALTLQEQALDVSAPNFKQVSPLPMSSFSIKEASQKRSLPRVTALGVYAKAKAALQRAVGATLVDNNVIVDDAYVNRMSRIGMSLAQKSKPPASR